MFMYALTEVERKGYGYLNLNIGLSFVFRFSLASYPESYDKAVRILRTALFLNSAFIFSQVCTESLLGVRRRTRYLR